MIFLQIILIINTLGGWHVIRKAIWRIWYLKSAVSALCDCLSFACFEKEWGKVLWIFQNSSIRHITNTFSYDMTTTLMKRTIEFQFLFFSNFDLHPEICSNDKNLSIYLKDRNFLPLKKTFITIRMDHRKQNEKLEVNQS